MFDGEICVVDSLSANIGAFSLFIEDFAQNVCVLAIHYMIRLLSGKC